MAPVLFKEMKGVNFSSASPAVWTNIDRWSMVRPTITSKLPIDRHFLWTKPLSHLPKPKPRSSLDHRPSTARASSSAPDPTSPANSAPSLLEESAFFDVYPEFDPDTASKMHYGDMSISGSTPRLLRPMRENTASSTLALLERTIYSHVRAQSQVPIDPSKRLQALNSSRSHHDQVWIWFSLHLFWYFSTCCFHWNGWLLSLLLIGGGPESVSALQRLWRKSEETQLQDGRLAFQFTIFSNESNS